MKEGTVPDAELTAYFDEFNSQALVQMATFLGVLPEKQRTKVVLTERILSRITDPKYIQSALERITEGERAVLDAVVRREGKTTIRNIRQELEKLRLIDTKARVVYNEYDYKNRPDPNLTNSRRLEDILARLMIKGLLFAEFGESAGYGYQTKRTFYDSFSTFYIPKFSRPYMLEPRPLPEATYSIHVKTVQESSARVFQRDLYLYWSFVRDNNTFLTRVGELQKSNLKEINNILQVREQIGTGISENHLPRMRFLRGILAALKLIQFSFEQVKVLDANDFFALTPAERVLRTFDAWKKTDQYNELLQLPTEIRPKSTNNPLIPAKPPVIRARGVILNQLGRLAKKNGANAWVSMQNLVDVIYDEDYEFLLKRTPASVSPYYSYSVNPYDYSGNEMMHTFSGIYQEAEGWKMVEARLIHDTLIGPLYWMGLVDLGLDESGKPVASRLTALGAWVFNLGPKPEIQVEGGRVIVQPNMQIMALDPILDSVLATLDQFSERLSAERAVEYRLTRESVYAGQLAGWSAGRIKETLQQFANAELPGNVARTLDEWQMQFERITIRPRVVLAHGAPEVLDQMMKNGQASNAVAERPMPELAVLKDEKAIARVVHQLRAQQILPVVNKQTSVPPGSLIADDEGNLRFTARIPSLYLHGHLVAFADPTEGGYKISHASVQRATRSGITSTEILQRLESVHSGPLPERLVVSIRAWAKHYGSAGLATMTLLQVRDEETLNELLEDPQLRRLMHKFEPKKTRALARVRPENVEKLKALLAERGVDLTDFLE